MWRVIFFGHVKTMLRVLLTTLHFLVIVANVCLGLTVPNVNITIVHASRVLVSTMVCLEEKQWRNNIFPIAGICNETSNTTFTCSCSPGWQNSHCETKINYCKATTCLNGGVCQPLLLNYTCQCVSGSYSGLHCEIISSKTVTFRTLSKSFAYIVIVAIISFAMLIIAMDVLKYGFGIDPASKNLLKRKQAKKASRTRRPVITRYIYVNALPFWNITESTNLGCSLEKRKTVFAIVLFFSPIK